MAVELCGPRKLVGRVGERISPKYDGNFSRFSSTCVYAHTDTSRNKTGKLIRNVTNLLNLFKMKSNGRR